MYLVDTSVWIDFLRGATHPHVCFLEELVASGDAAIGGIIYSEVCFGAKDKRQFEKYADYFGGLPFLTLPDKWHHELARMGLALRNEGYKPFVTDLLIALTAITHKTPLLTTDKDFEPYSKLFGLVLT